MRCTRAQTAPSSISRLHPPRPHHCAFCARAHTRTYASWLLCALALRPTVVRVCHCAAYVVGAAGANDCPTNYAKIMDEPTCTAAATSVPGNSYKGSVTSSSWPSGCFLNSLYGYAYLNLNQTGDGYPGYQPLCAAGARRPLHQTRRRRRTHAHASRSPGWLCGVCSGVPLCIATVAVFHGACVACCIATRWLWCYMFQTGAECRNNMLQHSATSATECNFSRKSASRRSRVPHVAKWSPC